MFSSSHISIFILSIFFLIITVEAFGHFGTKTSYFVTGSYNDSRIVLAGCQPAAFWLVARHGTRYPGERDIKALSSKLPILRDKIVKAWQDKMGDMEDQDIKEIMDWDLGIGLEEENLLTRSGAEEHFEMGRRWRSRLEDLRLEINMTRVRSSRKQRSQASAASFLMGFFNDTTENTDIPEIVTDDRLLRFYEICPKYLSESEDSYKEETEKFEASSAFEAVLARMTRKTGVDIELEDAVLLWTVCRFETAWFPETDSPWCNVFTEQDLEVFQFRDDLKYYYKSGPARNITSLMTEPLWSDLLLTLQHSNTETPRISLGFGHLETVFPLLASLGLYTDPHDLHWTDWPAMESKWKTSQIGAFASNFAVMMFDCGTQDGKSQIENESFEHGELLKEDNSSEESSHSKEDDSSEEDSASREDSSSIEDISSEKVNSSEETVQGVARNGRWQVMGFYQERPVIFPCCDSIVCSLESFLDTYSWRADNDLEDTCRM